MFEAIYNTVMGSPYKLSYFNYRGIAEPIRMIFKVAEIDFEDHRIEWDTAWNDEHKQKYPWGTLPVLTIGDQVLCHSIPIARFLARKFNLVGSTEFEAARCDELVEAMKDLQEEAIKVFVETDDEKKHKLLATFLGVTAPSYLNRFEKTCQANSGPWLVGADLTWADIFVTYGFDYLESTLGEEVLLTSYPGLQQLKVSVYEVPQIKDWLQNRPMGSY